MNTIATTQRGIATPLAFAEIHRIVEEVEGCSVAADQIRLTEVSSSSTGCQCFSISYLTPCSKRITVLRMPISLTPIEAIEVFAYMADLRASAQMLASSY